MPFAPSPPAGPLGAALPAALRASLVAALLAASAPSAQAKGLDSLADLAASVTDAVVNISAAQVTEEKAASAGPQSAPKPAPGTPLDDLFQDFFKRQLQKKGDKSDRGATTTRRAAAAPTRSARASSSTPPAS